MLAPEAVSETPCARKGVLLSAATLLCCSGAMTCVLRKVTYSTHARSWAMRWIRTRHRRTSMGRTLTKSEAHMQPM